jgi:hypothetical protein
VQQEAEAAAAAAAALALTGIDVERVVAVVQPPPQQPVLATATAGEDDDAALHQELLDCACWRDVMDVVEDEAGGMSARNLVLALSKLARSAGGRAGSGAQAAAASDDADNATTTTAPASAADRAALLASPALSALLARLEDALPAMTAFQAANSLYSLALLGVRLDSPPCAGLAAAADAAVARLAPAYNERDVASTLYAAAVSRRPPSDSAAVPLLRRAQALVARGEMAPRGVAMALWSCAALQGQLESGTSAGAGKQRKQQRRKEQEAEEEQPEQQPQQPDPSSPAPAFAAAAGPFAGVAAAFLSKPEAFAELAPQGVANACWALARLQGAAPAPLLEQACDLLARRAEEEWHRPQEVLNTLWSCVRSRHHPRAALPAVVSYCARRSHLLAAADIGSLFHALGTFAHAPEPPSLTALLRRADELLPAMGPVEAASLYWGLGLVRAGGAEGPGDKPTDPQQQPPSLFERLTTEHLPRLWREGRLAQRGLQRQAFTGYLCHRLAGGKLSLPREMLAELKGAWAEGLGGPGAAAAAAAAEGGEGASAASAPAAQPRARLSPLARDLHRRLRALRVAHDAGARTPDGLATVDAALRGGGGALAALVLASEGDFCSNLAPRKLLGPALFRRDLLERNGFARVRVVPSAEYAAVPPAARPGYVAELLRSLGVSVRRDALERAEAEAQQQEGQRGGRRGHGAAGAGAEAGAEAEAASPSSAPKRAGPRSGEGRVAMSWAGGVETAAAMAIAEANAAAAASAGSDAGEASDADAADADGPPADASKPRSARRAATALGAPGSRGGSRAARVTDAVATTAEINLIVDALVGGGPASSGGKGGGGGGKRGSGGGGPRRR